MPYRIIKEPAFFRIVLFDEITPQDLISLAEDVAALDRTLPVTLNRLTDLTHLAAPRLTYVAMLAFVEHRKAQQLASSVKSAIVAPEPVQVGFARMFQTLNDHPQIEIQVFASLEAAEAWLASS
jgi:hypothetical protein